MRFSEACYGFSQKEQGSNKCCSRLREAQLCYGKGVEEVLETFRCRNFLLHQLEKRTTEERYDGDFAKFSVAVQLSCYG